MFFSKDFKSINEKMNLTVLNNQKVSLYIKREDLIHPIISGNKFRKLKYNIREALDQQKSEILTFGGAYSNHLLACSFIGKLMGLKTTGIIRGDELSKKKLNSTLKKCQDFGMKFIFISREEYRRRNEKDYINSLKKTIKLLL